MPYGGLRHDSVRVPHLAGRGPIREASRGRPIVATQSPNPDPTTEWVTVSEDELDEIKFSFDVLGEEFIGKFLGTRGQSNDNGNYTQYRYEGQDGEVYFINGNYSLAAGMRNVRIGTLCRITYIADKDTGQPTPMRVLRVDVAKRNVKPAKGQPGYQPPAEKAGAETK